MKPGEHGLPGRQRVAHDLGIEDRLQEHRDTRDPEQRQAVLDEDRRTEEKLAGSDGDAEHDDARPDHAKPLQALWDWAAPEDRRRTTGARPERASTGCGCDIGQSRLTHRAAFAPCGASASQGERLTDNRTDHCDCSGQICEPGLLNLRRGAPAPRASGRAAAAARAFFADCHTPGLRGANRPATTGFITLPIALRGRTARQRSSRGTLYGASWLRAHCCKLIELERRGLPQLDGGADALAPFRRRRRRRPRSRRSPDGRAAPLRSRAPTPCSRRS